MTTNDAPQPSAKKRKSRQESEVTRLAKESSGDGCGLRFSTISVSLSKALRPEFKSLRHRFDEVSQSAGILNHVASLVVNAALIADPDIVLRFITDTDKGNINLQTMFGQAQSAAQRALGLSGRQSKTENHFAEHALAMVQGHISDSDAALIRDGFERVPIRAVQQCPASMATAFKLHLKSFRARLRRLLRMRLYDAIGEFLQEKYAVVQIAEDVASIITGTMQKRLDFETALGCYVLRKGVDQEHVDRCAKGIKELIQEQRQRFGPDLLTEQAVAATHKKDSECEGDAVQTETQVSKRRKTSSKKNPKKGEVQKPPEVTARTVLDSMLGNAQGRVRLLKQFKRVSDEMLEAEVERNAQYTLSPDDHGVDEDGDSEDDDDKLEVCPDNGDAGQVVPSADSAKRSRPKYARGRPYTMAPIWKLRPTQVLYNATEAMSLCSSIFDNLPKNVRSVCLERRRKTPEANEDDSTTCAVAQRSSPAADAAAPAGQSRELGEESKRRRVTRKNRKERCEPPVSEEER